MDSTALPPFLVSLLVAVAAGGLVGLEREWRGHAAGLRTHILVCVASAMLMEAAVSQGQWRFFGLPGTEIVSDPTRMAHGILTGIGFLCAGVIFRSGYSVHGLTTAASLWITAALGILIGAGLTWQAAVGAAATVAVLLVLRVLARTLPQRQISDVEVWWRDPEAAPRIESVLQSTDGACRLKRLEQDPQTGLYCRLVQVRTRDLGGVRALGEGLLRTRGVVGWSITPHDP